MYRITRRFTFSASHQLIGLPPDHPGSHLHGHNYRVELVLEAAALDRVGFVVDDRELGAFGSMIDETLHHRHLNDVLPPPDEGLNSTTAENIARFLYRWAKRRWPAVAEVLVSETGRTWASYSEAQA